MANEIKIPIPARLYNAAENGHVTGTEDIYDDEKGKTQKQINAEFEESIGSGGSVDTRIQSAVNTEKNRAEGVESGHNTRITTLETAVGTGGSVDSRIDAAKSEIKGNATSACDTLGKAEGLISAEATARTEAVSAETARAKAAEENLRTLYNNLQQSQPVPVTALPAEGEAGKIYRLAGESSYADYMYNEDDLTTPIKMAEYDNAIDDEPTAGSDNLVKSGGIILGISDFSETMFENDLMSKDLSHDVLVANGVMNTIPTYDGYCTDYIRVSKGEILIVDLYHVTENSSNNWGVLWGYVDKNGHSPVNLLPSPSSNVHNAAIIIPDGVNYIRACSKPFPYEDDRKPSVIPLISFLKNMAGVNLGNNVVDNKFFVAGGRQVTNENYRGFITSYIPVSAGEKYYIKGSTPYVEPPRYDGNIFVYADESTSNVISLGSLSEENAFTIIEIPDGYNYLRVCAYQNISPYGIIIIKVTEETNIEILNSLFNKYVETNNAALVSLKKDIKQEIDNLDCSDINNGEPDIYKTLQDLEDRGLMQSYDLENDVFTLYHKGSSNSPAITDEFTPNSDSLLHIKGHVDSITLTGDAPGIAVFVANGINPASGKYKKLGILSEVGDFDITVDIAYLIVHEQYANNFYVWFYNENIPTEDGEVTCVISGFKVLEYINAAGGTSISGLNAHELFNSIDQNISDIKQEIGDLSGNELISPSGNKYILSVSNNGTPVAIPVIPNKAAFFGNSLILSFETFGMAASEASKDYYSLITNYILSKNANFTAHPRLRGADFEFLETTDATQVNQIITSHFLDYLDGDEDLIVIQLGDNINNSARVTAFAQNIFTLLRAIRNKCQSARVVWMGMWYPSAEKYAIIENGCKSTGCEYILFDGLRTKDAENVIGGITRYENIRSWTIYHVISLTENTSTNITFTFTLNNISYTATIDVTSYSLSGETLVYSGYYRVINDAGVASHPGDEGMRRIANRFLYKTKISDTEETYQNN